MSNRDKDDDHYSFMCTIQCCDYVVLRNKYEAFDALWAQWEIYSLRIVVVVVVRKCKLASDGNNNVFEEGEPKEYITTITPATRKKCSITALLTTVNASFKIIMMSSIFLKMAI